jgi:hypothetical protein
MQTASFIGFIETVFYILIFYNIFKFLARLLLPLMVKKVVEKVGENIQKQQQNAQKQQQDFSNINKNQPPKSNKNVGEYVDYEEIE